MAIARRYSSVGPTAAHRRIVIKDFDSIKLLECEALCHTGAPERKMQVWLMLEVKVHEVSMFVTTRFRKAKIILVYFLLSRYILRARRASLVES